MPAKLSGGQQQRIALARAIVIEPEVLLMDEPLSNLDAKLRVEMRNAIKRIQKQFGITTIYVTHDQEEALAVSDRIAVMNNGVIQQIDTPLRIYQRPVNKFVSNFIGLSNFMNANIKKRPARRCCVSLEAETIISPCPISKRYCRWFGGFGGYPPGGIRVIFCWSDWYSCHCTKQCLFRCGHTLFPQAGKRVRGRGRSGFRYVGDPAYRG